MDQNQKQSKQSYFFKFKLYLSCKCGQLINWPINSVLPRHNKIYQILKAVCHRIVLRQFSSIQLMLIMLLDQPSHYARMNVQASQIFVYLHGYSISSFLFYINIPHAFLVSYIMLHDLLILSFSVNILGIASVTVHKYCTFFRLSLL